MKLIPKPDGSHLPTSFEEIPSATITELAQYQGGSSLRSYRKHFPEKGEAIIRSLVAQSVIALRNNAPDVKIDSLGLEAYLAKWNDYSYLPVACVKHFTMLALQGKFGKVYGTLTATELNQWLDQYHDLIVAERARVADQQHTQTKANQGADYKDPQTLEAIQSAYLALEEKKRKAPEKPIVRPRATNYHEVALALGWTDDRLARELNRVKSIFAEHLPEEEAAKAATAMLAHQAYMALRKTSE